MELPIKAVRGTIEGVERIGYLKASQLYKVPRSTLERRNKNGNKIAIGSRKFLGNRKSVLPSINVEVEVGKYVLVEFSGKKDKGALYVGCIVEILEGQRCMTRFLRRADLKKNRALKFKEVCDAESEEQAMGERGEANDY